MPNSPHPTNATAAIGIAETNVDTTTQAQLQTELGTLLARVAAARANNIGFPAAADIDYRPLAGFLPYMLNNLGDPNTDGAYPLHTKPQEREALAFVADLLHAPANDRYGYITSGATEGNEYALHLARNRYPGGIVYHSRAAHDCVRHVIDRLAMPSIVIGTDDHGEIDYHDLAAQIDRRRDRPAIIVANIGTAMSEAADDVRHITGILDGLAIDRRWIHADAALSGLPLALLEPHDRPGFDFADGTSSIVVSAHKFLGTPVPCGVVLVRDSHRPYGTRAATYTGCPDTTWGNSRSGLAALALWYALRLHGIAGLRRRAQESRRLAAYTHARLVEIGWNTYRHTHAFTVVLTTPPEHVTQKWALASHHTQSHIVCMPGITKEQIDTFIQDLQAVLDTTSATPSSIPIPKQRRNGRGIRDRWRAKDPAGP